MSSYNNHIYNSSKIKTPRMPNNKSMLSNTGEYSLYTPQPKSTKLPRDLQTSMFTDSTQSNIFNNNNRINARNHKVITQYELNQIKQRSCLTDPEVELFLKEKEKNKAIIEQRKQNFSVEAKVKAKEEKRFQKFKEIELERQKIDEQELKTQEKIRQNILQDANTKIFLNSEQVRKMKASLLHSQVLQERQEQIEFNKHKKEIQGIMENDYQQYEQLQIQKQEMLNQQKHDHKQRLKREQYKELQKQVEQNKQKIIDNYKEDKEQGNLVKQQAQEEQEQNELKRLQKKQILIQNKIDLQNHLVLQQKNKLNQKQQDLDQEKQIQEFNRQKEGLLKVRHLRTEQKRQEFNNQLDNLFKQQQNNLKTQTHKGKSDQQIENEEKQLLLLEQKKNEQKQKYLQQLRQQMMQQNELSIKQKKLLKQKENEQDKYYASNIFSNVKQQDKVEKDEKLFHLQRQLELKQFQLRQIQQKQDKRLRDITLEMQKDKEVKNHQGNNQKLFNMWVDDHFEQQDLNNQYSYPIQKQIQQINQSYQNM